MHQNSDRDEIMGHLVEKYSDHLLKICYVYLRNMASAKDSVQETFFRAFRSSKTYQMPTDQDACAWLTRIAINICKDQLRSAWNRHVDLSKDFEMIAPATEDPLVGETLSAVMFLPLKQREVVLAYYYQGLTMEQTAKQLRISRGTVHYRLQQAKQILRQYFDGGEADE